MTIPSPKKLKQGALMLPRLALDSNISMLATPTPSPMAIATPQNVATTHWRTVVCPHPPMKHHFYRKQNNEMSDDSSSNGGLVTPANLWPSPCGTPMGTPTAATSAFGFGYGTPTVAPANVGFGGFQDMPMASPVGSQGPALFRSTSPFNAQARMQTLSEGSPIRGDAGMTAMDTSMEVGEDMITPSPDKRAVQRMAVSPLQDLQNSTGPATPDATVFRGNPFGMF